MAIVSIIEWTNIFISVIVLFLIIISIRKFQKVKHMLHISFAFILTTIVLIIHIIFEILHLNEFFYAFTGSVIAVLLGYIVIEFKIKNSISFQKEVKK